MIYDEIKYEVAGKIATVTLNRPQQLNAWTHKMEDEVHHAMTTANQDKAIAVIILTGEGRGFCAGADMGNLNNLQEKGGALGPKSDSTRAVNNAITNGLQLSADFSMRYTYFPTIAKPVIAAINGPAAGLGLIMALYCDMRFASEAAVFSTAFARRGLIAEHGISWILPKLVGHANALDLLLSARKIEAQEAKAMGLVNKVFSTDHFIKEVNEYANELAHLSSPRSVRIMKKQVYSAMMQPLEQSVLVGNSEMPASFESDDFKEGVAHFIEKRNPKFTGE
ncbi:MAG: enoyl-CoA hydratase [Proteobacteria bacterium]|nr:enoyl-CoA hydratase [Pseudomonadota bacterium]|tara:strand:+ start:496 stop:1335 length:840 start_codon:yes stop_codon:yes gene_type:complete